MILWQRQASAQWLAAHEFLLEEIASSKLAVISRPGRVRSLVEVVCRSRAEAAKLRRDFGGVARTLPRNLPMGHPARESQRPIRIGRRLEVVSEESPSQKSTGKARLIIPAAGAFGTGDHTTTAMCLRLLEEKTRKLPPGWQLFDAGTGTGILALAARRLGAGKVLGLDDDRRAVAHARQNARLNQISRARFLTADLLRWKPSARYQVVTANLFSELLIAALPTFRSALFTRGHLIVSGILRDQAPGVIRALRRFGFRLETRRRRGKWVALLCRSSGL